MTAITRLTAMDTAFLAMERPGLPMHVGAVGVFEKGHLVDRAGRLRMNEIRRELAARIDRAPALRRRLIKAPLGAGWAWVDDPAFDIANHVESFHLPSPGNERALLSLAAYLWSQLLDRSRPLWHLAFVTGVEGGRVGLIERVHHAMVDGISGVDVAAILLDTDPGTPPQEVEPSKALPVPRASNWAVFTTLMRDRATAPVDALRMLAQDGGDVVKALRTLGEGGLFAPRSSLNHPVGSQRRFAVVRTRLDDVKRAGTEAGAKVNDVVLAAVAGGLRDLFLARGEPLPADLTLRVLVPVSLRRDDQRGTLGNQVGALVLPLPVGIGDPHDRLRAIAAASKALKASNESTTAGLIERIIDLAPPAIVRPAAAFLNHQNLVNLDVTNVPGPPFPLYLLGSRLLEAVPIVSLGGNISLAVAGLSYDGALTLGITADRDTCADFEVFAKGVDREFAALLAEGP